MMICQLHEMVKHGAASSIMRTGRVYAIKRTEEDLRQRRKQRSGSVTFGNSRESVTSIVVNKSERTISSTLEAGEDNWVKVQLINSDVYDQYGAVFIPRGSKKIIGIEEEMGVRTRLGVFLSEENELTRYMIQELSKFNYQDNNIENYVLRIFITMMVNRQNNSIARDKGRDFFEKSFHNRVEREITERVSEQIKDILWKKINRNEMLDLLYGQRGMIFDLNDWSRRDR